MERHDRRGPADGVGDASEVLVRERYDWTETPPSLALVDALSQLEGSSFDSDPASSPSQSPSSSSSPSPSLSRHIDPDALDALFTRQPAETPRVAVTIDGYRVQITDGEVVVRAALSYD